LTYIFHRSRPATLDDCSLLADLNRQFLLEKGHENVWLPHLQSLYGSMSSIPISKLQERMRNWLSRSYRGVLFIGQKEVLAYAIYQEGEYGIDLQQFFVVPTHRRKGIGRRCFEILRSEYWPRDKRLTLEVLVENEIALVFWRAIGYKDYSLELFQDSP
jgi:GNAT superfamily N-acetyltransferase